jgi:hypothetical protein
MPLTDTAVRNAKHYGKNYTLKDMDGLCLFIGAKGGKSWHFRFYWLGRQVRISLGSYPEISLKGARLARDQARAFVAQGIDPRAIRREERLAAYAAVENSFAVVFLAWRTFKAVTLQEGLHWCCFWRLVSMDTDDAIRASAKSVVTKLPRSKRDLIYKVIEAKSPLQLVSFIAENLDD